MNEFLKKREDEDKDDDDSASKMMPPAPAPAPASPPSPINDFECDYHNIDQIRHLSRSLLLSLATASIEKCFGDPFKSPLSVAPLVRNDLIHYLQHLPLSLPSSPGPDVASPSALAQDLLDQFVQSKTSFLSRVSSKLMYSETKEEQIEDLIQQLEDTETWIPSHREHVAKMLLKNLDVRHSVICGLRFSSEEELANHRTCCRFRPVACGNEGCNHVFSAFHVLEHDKSCAYKLLPCEQKCESLIIRSEMDKHCVTVCPMRPVKCPFFQVGCSNIIPLRELEQHCQESMASHLVCAVQIVHKQEALVSNLNQRVLLLEKALSMSQRSEAVDVGTLSLTIRQQEMKIKALEQETSRVKQELKSINVSKEVVQLRQELQILQRKLAS